MSLLFTDSAEIVLDASLVLAREIGSQYVGVDHLACVALESLEPEFDVGLGISSASIRSYLLLKRQDPERDLTGIRFSPRAVGIIANAIAEARQVDTTRVSPMLLAKYCLKDAVIPGIRSDVGDLFKKLRVPSSVVREAIEKIDHHREK